MGLFKNDPPPAPDYSGVAAASEKSAELAYKTSQEQLAWAKERYGLDSQLAAGIVGDMRASQQRQDQWAIDDRARYKAQYQPLEDSLIADAQSYNSPERQRLEAQKDMATVGTQFDAAREAASRNLESFGVDPTSTRYQALDVGSRNAQAAAQAGAGNAAVARTDAMGKALRSEAINIGRGYPGQAAAGAAGAVNAGGSASGVNLGTTASGASTMGTAGQWQGLGNQAVGQWGNTLNMGFNNRMTNYNAQNAGWGAALGLVGGAVGGYFGADEGGDITGAVPAGVSPSRGAAIDDVPARLTVGEFVIPKDVKEWKGEEFFHKLIEGSRKNKAAPKQAQPQFHPMPQQAIQLGA